ncbi:putative carboxylesterase 120 [Vitis vinifera]|uniref:Putative carboxylesterase 120 n=1 Tax=Vitis vinifera TaxID=29760 RepID=A0A438EE54_VITVI|nr:putative carboxylesterase 120 [Vitis vinifera]
MSETPKPSVSYNDSLKMVHNPDGSVTRLTLFPITSASPNPDQYTTHTSPFLSKDITINTQKNIWVRVFLPRQALENNATTSKSPLIVYFHGGGFITCSANTSVFHDLCAGMATDLSAVVVSLEYRLAPEYRLPAAYDDAEEALHWIKSTDEPWVTKYADTSCCFLMGSSAGGNMAYFAGVRVAGAVEEFKPLRIKGLIMHHPFFRRDEEEWGADRDHEYSNPMVGKGAEQCEKIGRLGWKVLVTGCEGDLLLDRQKEWVEMAKKKGVAVDSSFVEGGFHVIELVDASKAKAMFRLINKFMLSSA